MHLKMLHIPNILKRFYKTRSLRSVSCVRIGARLREPRSPTALLKIQMQTFATGPIFSACRTFATGPDIARGPDIFQIFK